MAKFKLTKSENDCRTKFKGFNDKVVIQVLALRQHIRKSEFGLKLKFA